MAWTPGCAAEVRGAVLWPRHQHDPGTPWPSALLTPSPAAQCPSDGHADGAHYVALLPNVLGLVATAVADATAQQPGSQGSWKLLRGVPTPGPLGLKPTGRLGQALAGGGEGGAGPQQCGPWAAAGDLPRGLCLMDGQQEPHDACSCSLAPVAPWPPPAARLTWKAVLSLLLRGAP